MKKHLFLLSIQNEQCYIDGNLRVIIICDASESGIERMVTVISKRIETMTPISIEEHFEICEIIRNGLMKTKSNKCVKQLSDLLTEFGLILVDNLGTIRDYPASHF